MACCFRNDDSLNPAIEILSRVVEEQPGDILPLDELASCYYRAGQYEQWIEACEAILEGNPRSRDALLFRDFALDESGRTEKAAGAYEAFLSVYPGVREAGFNLALCYFDLDRYREAIRLLEVLRAARPDRVEIVYLLGKCFYAS